MVSFHELHQDWHHHQLQFQRAVRQRLAARGDQRVELRELILAEKWREIAELADLAAENLGVAVIVGETVAAQMSGVIDDPRAWLGKGERRAGSGY